MVMMVGAAPGLDGSSEAVFQAIDHVYSSDVWKPDDIDRKAKLSPFYYLSVQ